MIKIYSATKVNYAWEEMEHLIQSLHRSYNPKYNQKVTGIIKRKMDQRDRLYRKLRKSRSKKDSCAFRNMHNQVNTIVKKFWSTIRKVYPS